MSDVDTDTEAPGAGGDTPAAGGTGLASTKSPDDDAPQAMWATWEPRLTDHGVELDVMKDDSPEIIQAKVRVALLKAQIAMLSALPVVQVEGYEEVDVRGKSVPVPPVPVEHTPLVPPLEAPPPVMAIARGGAPNKPKRRRNFAAPEPEPNAYDFAAHGLTAGPHGVGLAVVDTLAPPPAPVTAATLAEAGPRFSGQALHYDDAETPAPPLSGLQAARDVPESLGGAAPVRLDSESSRASSMKPVEEEAGGGGSGPGAALAAAAKDKAVKSEAGSNTLAPAAGPAAKRSSSPSSSSSSSSSSAAAAAAGAAAAAAGKPSAQAASAPPTHPLSKPQVPKEEPQSSVTSSASASPVRLGRPAAGGSSARADAAPLLGTDSAIAGGGAVSPGLSAPPTADGGAPLPLDRDDLTVGSDGLPSLLGTPMRGSAGPLHGASSGIGADGGGMGLGGAAGQPLVSHSMDLSQAPSRLSQVSLTDSTSGTGGGRFLLRGAAAHTAGIPAPIAQQPRQFGIGPDHEDSHTDNDLGL